MKTSVDQTCINVSNLERSVHFYEKVLGLEVTHRIEIPNTSEVVLAGAAYRGVGLTLIPEPVGLTVVSGPASELVAQ